MVTEGSRARRSTATAPASLPPDGLPGLDPAWSRLVDFVDADGVPRQLHVLDSGVPDDGSDPAGTLLCVHGNPTWSYLWRALVATPPAGWRVVAVDQLGMGWSERIGEVRRLAQRVDDLGRVVEALGIDGPVITVAHDWGGPVSLGWALSHPEQLVGVVLTNTAVHQPPGSPAPALIRTARAPGMLKAVCELTPTFVRGTTALSRPRLVPAGAGRLRGAVRDPGPAGRGGGLRGRHPAGGRPPVDARAHRDRRRRTAPRGAGAAGLGPADPVFSDRYLRDLVERIPHADVHRYEGASHLVTEDAPALFDDLREWVEQLGSPTEPPPSSAPKVVRRGMGAALAQRAADPRSADEVAVCELGQRRAVDHLATARPGRRRPRCRACRARASSVATGWPCWSRPAPT